MGKGQKPVRLSRLKVPKRRASQRLKKLHKPSPTSEDDNGSMEPDLEFSFELLDQDPRNDASIAQRSLPPYDDAWLDPDYFGPTYSLDADTSWNPALVYTCSEIVGGIGNIRNSKLNCVRFAIYAGAALVEPTIVLRNDADSAEIRTASRRTWATWSTLRTSASRSPLLSGG
ncbi:hypothetical protein ACLOAV_008389 [Pseudogymnoascus australis]